jgi:hypothetical protein
MASLVIVSCASASCRIYTNGVVEANALFAWFCLQGPHAWEVKVRHDVQPSAVLNAEGDLLRVLYGSFRTWARVALA